MAIKSPFEPFSTLPPRVLFLENAHQTMSFWSHLQWLHGCPWNEIHASSDPTPSAELSNPCPFCSKYIRILALCQTGLHLHLPFCLKLVNFSPSFLLSLSPFLLLLLSKKTLTQTLKPKPSPPLFSQCINPVVCGPRRPRQNLIHCVPIMPGVTTAWAGRRWQVWKPCPAPRRMYI